MIRQLSRMTPVFIFLLTLILTTACNEKREEKEWKYETQDAEYEAEVERVEKDDD